MLKLNESFFVASYEFRFLTPRSAQEGIAEYDLAYRKSDSDMDYRASDTEDWRRCQCLYVRGLHIARICHRVERLIYGEQFPNLKRTELVSEDIGLPPTAIEFMEQVHRRSIVIKSHYGWLKTAEIWEKIHEIDQVSAECSK